MTDRRRIPLLAALTALLLGCGQTPIGLDVDPRTLSLGRKGESRALTAKVKDQKGGLIDDAPVEWKSSDPKIVTVDPAGKVTAVSSGVATVMARTADVSGQSIITVLIPGSIHLEPVQVLLRGPGATAAVAVRVLDEKDQVMPAEKIVWTSDNPAIATVEGGKLTGVADGQTTVTATFADVSAKAPVVVRSPQPTTITIDPSPVVLKKGATQQLNLTVIDELGERILNPAITWTTANSAVALVDRLGLVTAVGKGDTIITAQAGTALSELVVKVR